jgi:hypothetical protein
MKKMFCMAVLFAGVFLGGQSYFGLSVGLAEDASADGTVTAYYFHTSFRCPTCQKLEQYSKEAIESNFKDALASGKVSFTVVNVESSGNEHYVNDYQLYTKSLVLSLAKDGKEVRSKNLDRIWQLVGNKQQFQNYVRDEVSAFINEV